MTTMNKILSSDPDVALVHTNTLTTFGVSSKVLCLASPVLSTVLAQHFPGGEIPPAARRLLEVKLWDDLTSPEALEIILNVLHYRYRFVGKRIDPAILYDIAVLADKYGLTEVLGLWKDAWVKEQPLSGKRLLCIQFLFRDKDGFTAECRRMALTGDSSDEEDSRCDPDGRWDGGLLGGVLGIIYI